MAIFLWLLGPSIGIFRKLPWYFRHCVNGEPSINPKEKLIGGFGLFSDTVNINPTTGELEFSVLDQGMNRINQEFWILGFFPLDLWSCGVFSKCPKMLRGKTDEKNFVVRLSDLAWPVHEKVIDRSIQSHNLHIHSSEQTQKHFLLRFHSLIKHHHESRFSYSPRHFGRCYRVSAINFKLREGCRQRFD